MITKINMGLLTHLPKQINYPIYIIMKKTIRVLSFSILAIACGAQKTPDAIIGRWVTTAGDCNIEICKQNRRIQS